MDRIRTSPWRRLDIPKYLFQISYTQQGLQGLLKEGGARRREALGDVFDSVGGKLEAFYYAFGSDDAYIIAEMPDDASAAAASITVGAAGAISVRTTVLVEPETIDDAIAKSVTYRPPGA